MGHFEDYKPEEANNALTGNHRCVLVEAEEAVSKSSGLPMWVLTVTPNGSKAKVKAYIVKNEHFNRNMTTFFDSFGIERGDFNSLGWINAMGAANFGLDDNGFLKVKWFLVPRQSANLPPWEGVTPERQTVSDLTPLPDDADNPFNQ